MQMNCSRLKSTPLVFQAVQKVLHNSPDYVPDTTSVSWALPLRSYHSLSKETNRTSTSQIQTQLTAEPIVAFQHSNAKRAVCPFIGMSLLPSTMYQLNADFDESIAPMFRTEFYSWTSR